MPEASVQLTSIPLLSTPSQHKVEECQGRDAYRNSSLKCCCKEGSRSPEVEASRFTTQACKTFALQPLQVSFLQ
eukprot:468939-Amphidinium_carterae.1